MELEKSNNENLFTEKLSLDCSCIITAAGLSSRMGRWKPFLKTPKGISFIDQAIETASICASVIVVGGYRYKDLLSLIGDRKDLIIVENTNYREGMLSSVKTALSHVNGGFFILPVDMPLLTPSHLQEVYRRRDAEKIVRPNYHNKPGHPVYFPSIWKDQILRFEGDKINPNLQKQDVFTFSCNDDSVVFDVDRQEDYDLFWGRQE